MRGKLEDYESMFDTRENKGVRALQKELLINNMATVVCQQSSQSDKSGKVRRQRQVSH